MGWMEPDVVIWTDKKAGILSKKLTLNCVVMRKGVCMCDCTEVGISHSVCVHAVCMWYQAGSQQPAEVESFQPGH